MSREEIIVSGILEHFDTALFLPKSTILVGIKGRAKAQELEDHYADEDERKHGHRLPGNQKK